MIVTTASVVSTIELSSLSTRLVSHFSIHSNIMGIILTATTLMIMGTIIIRGLLTDTTIDPESQRSSADLLALGTIMVPLMESWALKLGEQFAVMNATIMCRRRA